MPPFQEAGHACLLFQEVCTQCDSHTYTTKAPVEWVDYNTKMLCQLFQNGDTKEYKLLAGPNGKCVAGGKETEIPNLIVAVKKKPSAPLKEQEKEDEEGKGVADPPVDPPVEEQEENEEEDEEDNVDEEEEEEMEPMEEEEEEDWEEECDRSDEDVKVVAVGEGKKHGEKSKVKGNRAKGVDIHVVQEWPQHRHQAKAW